MDRAKIVVERHADGFVAYPLGIVGGGVGKGETAEEAIADATSTLRFHVETFGPDVLAPESLVLDASAS